MKYYTVGRRSRTQSKHAWTTSSASRSCFPVTFLLDNLLDFLCDETDNARRASPHLVDILVVFRLELPKLVESYGVVYVDDVALDATITKSDKVRSTNSIVNLETEIHIVWVVIYPMPYVVVASRRVIGRGESFTTVCC